jgi:hypothetical protein
MTKPNVRVVLSTEERAKIKSAAAREGLGISAWLRRLALLALGPAGRPAGRREKK